MPVNEWYSACRKAAAVIYNSIPEPYRLRTFSGIIGDIKALPPKKALSLFSRKKGLGTQYAYLYLTEGIDDGRGYQACAAEALSSVLGSEREKFIHGRILDVGCAIGVTSGILSLRNVTGFDLFPDLIHTAVLVESFTSASNNYLVADMTGIWPFHCVFDTVVCGLVCHHLKNQSDILLFFSQTNQVLKPSGSIVITLPSGSIASAAYLKNILDAVENFGFKVDKEYTGLVLSSDSEHSLFWMFQIIARKVSDNTGDVFINPDFSFPVYRTLLSRVEKGARVRKTVVKTRKVYHTAFTLIPYDELAKKAENTPLVFETVSRL